MQTTLPVNVRQLAKATVEITDGYLVCIRVKDNVELDEGDMLEIYEYRKQIIGDNPYAVVLVSGQHSSISTDARRLAARPEHAYYRRAFGMVVHSLAQRLMGNFYIRFDKPPSPTRLFTDEKKAVSWVKSFFIKETEELS